VGSKIEVGGKNILVKEYSLFFKKEEKIGGIMEVVWLLNINSEQIK
jgi:hypothetical protein